MPPPSSRPCAGLLFRRASTGRRPLETTCSHKWGRCRCASPCLWRGLGRRRCQSLDTTQDLGAVHRVGQQDGSDGAGQSPERPDSHELVEEGVAGHAGRLVESTPRPIPSPAAFRCLRTFCSEKLSLWAISRRVNPALWRAMIASRVDVMMRKLTHMPPQLQRPM